MFASSQGTPYAKDEAASAEIITQMTQPVSRSSSEAFLFSASTTCCDFSKPTRNPVKSVPCMLESGVVAPLRAHVQAALAIALVVVSPPANRGLLSKPFSLGSPNGANVDTA